MKSKQKQSSRWHLRAILSSLLVVSMSTKLNALNDWWLSYSYSVRVHFEAQNLTDVDPPSLKQLSMPSYPIDLSRSGVGGEATIRFIVEEDGSITGIQVVKTDFQELGLEAKAAIEKCAFVPARNRVTRRSVSEGMVCHFVFSLTEK